MTGSLLEKLTSTPCCWQTDVLANATQAVKEIQRLSQQESLHHIHRDQPSAEDLSSFQEWMQQQSDQHLVVHVQHVGREGLGLVAQQDIEQDEVFMSIPFKMVLGSHVKLGPPLNIADNSPWQYVSNDPLLNSFPSCLLALRLLAEACKYENSFFYRYITILPTSFEIPLFYNASDFAFLEGSSLFEPAVKLLYNSIKQFCYLRRLLKIWTQCPIPSEKFTIGNYFWALGAVLTRQNDVAVSSTETTLALIPGWDMCNHEQYGSVITTFSDPGQKVIRCHAFRKFQCNEQVKMFYGPRSNEQLLLYSGFVIDSNAYDCVQLRCKLDKSDSLYKVKRLLIGKEPLPLLAPISDDEVHVCYEVDARGMIAKPAMSRAMQVLHMKKENLSHALRSTGVVGSENLYKWSDLERDEVLHHHRANCTEARAATISILNKKVCGKHIDLLKRYFQILLRLQDVALQIANPFAEKQENDSVGDVNDGR